MDFDFELVANHSVLVIVPVKVLILEPAAINCLVFFVRFIGSMEYFSLDPFEILD